MRIGVHSPVGRWNPFLLLSHSSYSNFDIHSHSIHLSKLKKIIYVFKRSNKVHPTEGWQGNHH